MHLGMVAWVIDCLEAIGSRLEIRLFFRKRSCPEVLFWAQLVENARGRCCVVAIKPHKVRRSSTILPEGEEGKKWFFVRDALNNMRLRGLGVKSEDENVVLFEPSDSILLVKDKANDSWMKIEKGVKVRFGPLKPFCGNIMVVLCEDIHKRQELLDFGKWAILDCAISFLPWSSNEVVEERCLPFFRSWVKLLDLPSHSQTMSTISKLVDLCGGLEGVCESSIQEEGWDEELRIFVNGRANGFIPRGPFLNWEGIDFPVQFIHMSNLDSGVQRLEDCSIVGKKNVLSLSLKRSYVRRSPSTDDDVELVQPYPNSFEIDCIVDQETGLVSDLKPTVNRKARLEDGHALDLEAKIKDCGKGKSKIANGFSPDLSHGLFGPSNKGSKA